MRTKPGKLDIRAVMVGDYLRAKIIPYAFDPPSNRLQVVPGKVYKVSKVNNSNSEFLGNTVKLEGGGDYSYHLDRFETICTEDGTEVEWW
jgi:hypothetical protein